MSEKGFLAPHLIFSRVFTPSPACIASSAFRWRIILFSELVEGQLHAAEDRVVVRYQDAAPTNRG